MRDWTLSRRHMLKASTALVGAAFAQSLKAQTLERGFVTRSLIDARALWRRRVTKTYRDYVNLHELTRQWPDGRDLLPLLADLARYLGDQEQLSLGDFILRGDRMDDYWIENGVDCWPHFGFFMHLPDGSRVGQWFRDGESSDNIPIVYIGSEGEVRMEASNLEEFLAVWALAQFDKRGNLVANGQQVSLPFDLLYEADSGAPDGRNDFLGLPAPAPRA
jgi:hypothetical protein